MRSMRAPTATSTARRCITGVDSHGFGQRTGRGRNAIHWRPFEPGTPTNVSMRTIERSHHSGYGIVSDKFPSSPATPSIGLVRRLP